MFYHEITSCLNFYMQAEMIPLDIRLKTVTPSCCFRKKSSKCGLRRKNVVCKNGINLSP